MWETEKIPTRNEASQPIRVKHVATTCATPPVSHQCRTESQVSKKKKKKGKKWERHIYTHIKYLVTPHQNMCIRAKANKPPHIPVSVRGMDDPKNRGGQLMSPAKPPVSSRIMIKDEWRLQDRHPSNGRWSKTSNVTLVHLRAVTKHLFPFLLLKGQLTISPSPKRYKERMNITINVPTDKEKGAYTRTERCI